MTEGSAPARELDYVPLTIFVPFTVISLGIYPNVWLALRARAFSAISGGIVDSRAVRRCALFGSISSIAAIIAVVLASSTMLAAAIGLFVLFALPLRCFCHSEIRSGIRRSAAEWDADGRMAERTIPSSTRLAILGSIYIQHHINRLIGLGMPGFSGYDDARERSRKDRPR